MTDEIIDTEKAQALVDCLNGMTNQEIGYAFENMCYDGILNINCIISHALLSILQDAKNRANKDKH